MKPATFDFEAPTTVDEAVGLLRAYGDDAKVLAGGQSLVPLLALRLTRFDRLVDVNRIPELQQISRDDSWLTVGAMVRQRAAERSADVASATPLLARALPKIGHFQIRNRGTVGGSIAHADPAAELPAVTLALDAELVATGGGGVRTIPAREFFVSTWTTALAADELLTAVRYPVWSGRCGFAIEELAPRNGDFAIVGVACGIELDGDGRVVRAAVVTFGMGSTPHRAAAAESGLLGQNARTADLVAISAAAVVDAEASDDIHATATYRRRVAAHLARRAISRAIEEATVG
jgi:aerobic carbon-monoxide dehydrogenase medium subunit